MAPGAILGIPKDIFQCWRYLALVKGKWTEALSCRSNPFSTRWLVLQKKSLLLKQLGVPQLNGSPTNIEPNLILSKLIDVYKDRLNEEGEQSFGKFTATQLS